MFPDPITVRAFDNRLPRPDQRPIPRASEIRLRVRRQTRLGA
jgi:hypothetical protein